MQDNVKTCKSCGHSCHCYSPDCETCGCDVCDCGTVKPNQEDIPSSFTLTNT